MYENKLSIKDWAEEDRPREKLQLKGATALSDAELLAILIGSGNKKETAVELSQRILHYASNNLNELGRLSIKDFVRNFNGIGEAKAITIIAALELGKRRKIADALSQPQIVSSVDVFNIFQPLLGDLKHEEVWVLLLNRANKVIKRIQISQGGVTSSVIDIRLIMKEALENLASGMIICHNHPSGQLNPSKDDDNITKRLQEAGRIMEIALLDHLIIGDKFYYSYRDEGQL